MSLRRDRARARFRGPLGACRFWYHVTADSLRSSLEARRNVRDPVHVEVHVSNLVMDLRFAARTARRNLRVALPAAISLALGVGATTAILTVTKRVLVDPLPYPDSERLALVWSEMPTSGFQRYPISGPELDDLRTRSRELEELASIWTTTGALVENGEPESLRLGLVTWNFPAILGAEPILGRPLGPEDEGTGVDAVLISEGLWRRRFGGEPDVLGRRIRIDGGWGFRGGEFTVVGVLPESFRLVLPSDAGVATDLDLWVPFKNDLKAGPRSLYYLRTVARLRPGATIARARDEAHAIGERLEAEYPDYSETGRGFNVVSLKGDAVSRTRPVLLALVAGTLFLLLVTCANVANLLLARAAERQEEMRLRAALGASGGQIALQLLSESLLLAAVGGLGGVALGGAALHPLLALEPGSLPRHEAIGLDPLVALVALAASLLGGVLFGLAPVLAARKEALQTSLRNRGDGALGARGRRLLVVTELALAFVLSVSAVLCFRTLTGLERVDLGFRTEGVLTMELTLPSQRYGRGIDLDQFTRELERRMRQLPGVVAAGAINQLPLSDLPNWSSPYRLRGATSEGDAKEADGRVVTPGYFEAVDAALVEGRFFEQTDDADAAPVVIVDDLLVSKAFGGATPLGREIEIQVRKERGFVTVWAEIVGVVRHMRHHDPRFDVREQFFVPFAQGARNQMALAVRTTGDPSALAGPVRAALAGIDGDLAISRLRPLEDYARDARAVQRFTVVLAGAFAAMSLFLGGLGLYGVVSHTVHRRRREIGLRMALGSTSSRIVRSVLGQGAALVAAGLSLGLLLALSTGRLLSSLLYEVSPEDPTSFAAVAVFLVVVALAASFFPARRAARVDPTVALRED